MQQAPPEQGLCLHCRFLYFSCKTDKEITSLFQAELGLNEHHQNEVVNYMRFARSRRGLRLKTVDSCFQDLKESRYQKTVRKPGGEQEPSWWPVWGCCGRGRPDHCRDCRGPLFPESGHVASGVCAPQTAVGAAYYPAGHLLRGCSVSEGRKL